MSDDVVDLPKDLPNASLNFGNKKLRPSRKNQNQPYSTMALLKEQPIKIVHFWGRSKSSMANAALKEASLIVFPSSES